MYHSFFKIVGQDEIIWLLFLADWLTMKRFLSWLVSTWLCIFWEVFNSSPSINIAVKIPSFIALCQFNKSLLSSSQGHIVKMFIFQPHVPRVDPNVGHLCCISLTIALRMDTRSLHVTTGWYAVLCKIYSIPQRGNFVLALKTPHYTCAILYFCYIHLADMVWIDNITIFVA